jgi:hypothetical protein
VSSATRRAERLVCWYPAAWRARYAEEFVELLAADIAERPLSWRRTADVARSGLAARLGWGGLAHGLEPARRARASLASLASATGAFLIVGIAMWSQLAIGWQWSRPATQGTAVAVVLMTYLVVAFGLLVLLAAVPYAWASARFLVRREAGGLLLPLFLLGLAAAGMVIGARHFATGWPGTGGHPWVHQHLVPGRLAALAWASTLSITSYWAHPTALLGFPATEVAWMAASPAALVCLVVAAAQLIRRVELSPRAIRFELALARLGCVAMVGFVVAPCMWIVGGGTGPRNLFHIGAIDLVDLAVMGVMLVVACRSIRQVRAAVAGLCDQESR